MVTVALYSDVSTECAETHVDAFHHYVGVKLGQNKSEHHSQSFIGSVLAPLGKPKAAHALRRRPYAFSTAFRF